MGRKVITAAIVALVSLALISHPTWADQVPNPTVTGPIPVNVDLGDPSHDYPFFTPMVDFEAYGYVQEEFFIEGEACNYTVPVGTDGTGIVNTCGHTYKTRIVIRRPISPTRFNGTVVLEWQNVTAGFDLDAHWGESWEHFMRSGYAWVGVDAQRVGVHQPVTGLRDWSPIRYGTLDLTDGGMVLDDSLCYDIFSQAAQSIRSPMGIDPMGGLPVELILATGASQSEDRLVVYHNSVHPLHGVVDGFYLALGVGRKVRTDLDVKVFKMNTETDLLFLGEAAARQEDSDHLRTWEIAGASHIGYFSAISWAPILARDGFVVAPVECTSNPYSRMPARYVTNAAYDHLVRWVRDGLPPPTAPRIEILSIGPPVVIARNSLDLAIGGVQLPDIVVPTAYNSGVNSGPGYCGLYGTFEPFDDDTLWALYRNHGAYVAAFDRSVIQNLKAGYIVTPDAQEMRVYAAHADVPPK